MERRGPHVGRALEPNGGAPPPVHATLAPPANAAAWREFVADLSLPSERDTGVLIDRLLPLRMLTLQHDGQVGLAPPFTPAASRATRFAVALC